jgi:hypothetical protein
LSTKRKTHIHDEWTQMKMKTSEYKSYDLYSTPKDPVLSKGYEEYKKARLRK